MFPFFIFYFFKKKGKKFAFWVCGNVADSYGQGLLVLEQCLSAQPSEGQASDGDDSRAMVLMAMSTLFSERLQFFSPILDY